MEYMHSLQLTRKALIGKQALYNYNYKKHSAKRRKLASEGDATSYSGLDMASSYVECADVSELTTADDGAVSKMLFFLGKSVVLSTPKHGKWAILLGCPFTGFFS
jgi:hypothetical protein